MVRGFANLHSFSLQLMLNNLHRPTIDNPLRSLQCSHKPVGKVPFATDGENGKLRALEGKRRYRCAKPVAVGLDLSSVNPLEILMGIYIRQDFVGVDYFHGTKIN
jgi:hypothetical protein